MFNSYFISIESNTNRNTVRQYNTKNNTTIVQETVKGLPREVGRQVQLWNRLFRQQWKEKQPALHELSQNNLH